jgi:hypothetical protein
MKRLNIVVEGQAEETFVNDVLAGHLANFDVGAFARRVEFSRRRERIYRGGLLEYPRLKKDVTNWLKQDQGALVTTMVDLYALPVDFPKKDAAQKIRTPLEKVAFLENAFADDIGSRNFIPNIQLHEFETLLFVNIEGLRSYYPAYSKAIGMLNYETKSIANPEDINNGPTTAPSKRILRHIPIYDKVTVGSLMITDLGLPAIRSRCRHFNEWLGRLEQLTQVDNI